MLEEDRSGDGALQCPKVKNKERIEVSSLALRPDAVLCPSPSVS